MVANMSFERPFTKVMKDPNWTRKILIGGLYNLLSVILIGAFVMMGYQKRFFLSLIKDEDAQMPEIEFGNDLQAGLPIFGIYICYYLPVMLLSAIPLVGLIFRLVGPIVMVGVIPIALTRYYTTGRFGAAFEFNAIYEFIRGNFNNAALFLGIALIGGFIGGLGSIACLVGMAFTGFFAANVITIALSDLHRLSQQAPAQADPAAPPPTESPASTPQQPPPSEPSP